MSSSGTTTGLPAYTLILDQAAHLDWDWIRTFAQNYWYYTGTTSTNAGVDTILQQAIDNIQQQIAEDPYSCSCTCPCTCPCTYYYTICEMGFLRRFVETHLDAKEMIAKCGRQFQIISGGITSPDCLVCSGEAFVRNYLEGQKWAKSVLKITPKPYCWLPDDFGQGPELPSLLTALGFEAVSFSRLKGTYRWSPNNSPTIETTLQEQGFDFTWKSSDGSRIFTHWMVQRYGLGNDITDPSKGIPWIIDKYCPQPCPPCPSSTYTGAVTPYMYIPIDDDFTTPISNLAAIIKDWNTQSAAANNVSLVQGTFESFYNTVKRCIKQNPRGPALRERFYNGTPYLTGYYASRPELKRLHYETTRALVAAEIIGLLTQPSNPKINSMLPTNFWTRIDQAWIDFLPSTHHDFVTGTAPDPVYAGDQLPLIQGVAATSIALRAAALIALAGMVSTSYAGNQSFSPGIIVTNTLGFTRSGFAEIEAVDPLDGFNYQTTAEGGMFVYVANVKGLGYMVCDSSYSVPQPVSVKITPTSDGANSYVLSNKFLTATISADAGWGISKLIDSKNNDVLGNQPGNSIIFYDDSQMGGIYSFSNEFKTNGSPVAMPEITDVVVQTSGFGLGASVIEEGPLRVRLRTEALYTVTFQGTVSKVRFVREYELRAGESILRMKTTGSAPKNTSVMTKFPLALPVTGFTHGTLYHWTDYEQLDTSFWGPPCFQATHDFVIPYHKALDTNKQTILAAIYHGSTPAWAFDAQGALIGCILRNAQSFRTQADPHGAYGTDPARWTQSYAIRIPNGLDKPESCQPLQEAQMFHTPLYALQLPNGPSAGPLPSGLITASSGSIASTPADSKAILTVAKPGSYDHTSLILRLYQPTNLPLDVPVSLSDALPAPSSAKMMTATETKWEGEGTAEIVEGQVSVSMAGAVATVSIAGMGRGPVESN